MENSFTNDSFSSNVPYEQSQYYSYIYRGIGTFFQLSIFSLGVSGNILVCIVLKITRSMHTTTNCYLFSLAVADCLVLLSSVPNEVLSYYLIGNKWLYGRFGCAAFTFLQYWSINCSSLCLTAFTTERYIAICWPMKAHAICTVKRARTIIYAVWIFSLCYSMPWLGLTTTKPVKYIEEDTVYCTFNLTREKYLLYFFSDLILFYIIPLSISCVLYGLIIRILLSHNVQLGNEEAMEHSNESRENFRKSRKSQKAKMQVVKMLVAVVTIFAFLWIPYRGMLVYNSFASPEKKFMDLWFLMFAKTCVYINSAINPFLYSAMSKKFRKAFAKVLFWRRFTSQLRSQRSTIEESRSLSWRTNSTRSLSSRSRHAMLKRIVLESRL